MLKIELKCDGCGKDDPLATICGSGYLESKLFRTESLGCGLVKIEFCLECEELIESVRDGFSETLAAQRDASMRCYIEDLKASHQSPVSK